MQIDARQWIPYLFIAPSLIAILILVFYALVNGIYLSFTDANQYSDIVSQ